MKNDSIHGGKNENISQAQLFEEGVVTVYTVLEV